MSEKYDIWDLSTDDNAICTQDKLLCAIANELAELNEYLRRKNE